MVHPPFVLPRPAWAGETRSGRTAIKTRSTASRARAEVRAAVLLAAGLGFALRPACSTAQALPSVSPEKLFVSAEQVESLVILVGDDGASGGAYRFHGNGDFNLTVDKFGGSGDFGTPTSIGDSGIKWNPYIAGNIGFLDSTGNQIPAPLTGNTYDVKTTALELGGGARFWLTDHFSLLPSLSAIYGRTQESFNALNDVGNAYLPAMQKAGWVDWSLDSWTVIPGLEAKYVWNLGRTTLYWQSVFEFYHTESVNNSSAIDINGNSETWKNVLDIDIPLGWKLFGHELHTGGHADQTMLFGNLSDGFDTEHLYTVNGRLVLDMLSTFKMLSWVGLGATYSWSGNLSGWSVGIEIRLNL
jgi:hypothetical protein